MSVLSTPERSKSCPGNQGFTLPEILVGVVLFAILTSLIFAFLIPTMRASVLGATRAEMQQEALLAINKIISDLLLSSSASVSIFSTGTTPAQGPVYLGLTRLDNVDAIGNQVWEEAVIVYSWKRAGEPLIRKMWTPSSPPSLGIPLSVSTPMRFDESALRTIANEPGLKGQILVRDVSEFRITSTGLPPSVSSPIDVYIKVTRQAATGRRNPEVFEINRSVTLRTQL